MTIFIEGIHVPVSRCVDKGKAHDFQLEVMTLVWGDGTGDFRRGAADGQVNALPSAVALRKFRS